jgi:hypothetical protein
MTEPAAPTWDGVLVLTPAQWATLDANRRRIWSLVPALVVCGDPAEDDDGNRVLSDWRWTTDDAVLLLWLLDHPDELDALVAAEPQEIAA